MSLFSRSKLTLISNTFHTRAFLSIHRDVSFLPSGNRGTRSEGKNISDSIDNVANPTHFRTAAFSTHSKPSSFANDRSKTSSIKQMAQDTRFLAGTSGSEGNFRNGKPTLEYARTLPKTFASMTNEQVLHFAMQEIPEACRECVVRDIMVVDNIEYDEAMKVFEKIAECNRRDMIFASLPFRVGFTVAFTGGIASIPLVFDLQTVTWFNEAFVTSELPGPEDLETWLEVGAASWGWMEPVLGQVSFFLLCMQFARAQLQNLGIRPYFNWQQEHRARELCKRYPQYDAEFLTMYSKCDKLADRHVMAA